MLNKKKKKIKAELPETAEALIMKTQKAPKKYQYWARFTRINRIRDTGHVKILLPQYLHKGENKNQTPQSKYI